MGTSICDGRLLGDYMQALLCKNSDSERESTKALSSCRRTPGQRVGYSGHVSNSLARAHTVDAVN